MQQVFLKIFTCWSFSFCSLELHSPPCFGAQEAKPCRWHGSGSLDNWLPAAKGDWRWEKKGVPGYSFVSSCFAKPQTFAALLHLLGLPRGSSPSLPPLWPSCPWCGNGSPVWLPASGCLNIPYSFSFTLPIPLKTFPFLKEILLNILVSWACCLFLTRDFIWGSHLSLCVKWLLWSWNMTACTKGS